MRRKVLLSLCVGMMCCLGACSPQKRTQTEDVASTSCGNITMGEGSFAYGDDYIYFAGLHEFYEYDLLSGKTVILSTNDLNYPQSIYLEDDYIYFANGGLKRIRRDGKKLETVYNNTQGSLQLYVDGDKAYFLDGLDGTLYCRDMESEQEEALLSGVLSYHIDQGNLYVVNKENDVRHLYKSSVDEAAFEAIELSFEPIAVFAADDAIYLSTMRTYDLVQYKDGVETALPIRSVYYQVVGDQLIYLDDDTAENSCFQLVMYNLKTGEKQIVCSEAYSFCILADKYIAIHQYEANYLYDMEEKTLTLMYEIEE